LLEKAYNSSGTKPQASPQPYGRLRDILVWFDTYNSVIMSGSVPQDVIGTSLSTHKLNKKDLNEINWYQEIIDNIQNTNSQPSILQNNPNPPQTPIA